MPQRTFEDVAIAEIKAEMARQDITQAELAKRLGWVQTSVSKRFHGKVALTARDIDNIARALGVSVQELGCSFMTSMSRKAS